MSMQLFFLFESLDYELVFQKPVLGLVVGILSGVQK